MDLNASLQPFLIVMVCVFGITQCLVTWLAYRLFQEFGWKIYKKIGADPNIKSKLNKLGRALFCYCYLRFVNKILWCALLVELVRRFIKWKEEKPRKTGGGVGCAWGGCIEQRHWKAQKEGKTMSTDV